MNTTRRENTLFKLFLNEERESSFCVCVSVCTLLFVNTHPAFIGSFEASSPYSLYAITSERRAECLYMIVSGY